MTLNDFNNADEMEQLEAVWAGVLVGERKDDINNIRLYQIDGFYVEEYIHREHDVRVKFNSFSNTELLDAYVSLYDLKMLGLK